MLRASVNGDLLPTVAGDSKAAAAAKTDAFLSKYGAAFGAGAGELTRSEIASDGLGGWTSSYTQSYQGIPVFGEQDQGPRQRRRRTDRRLGLRRS